MEIFFLIKKMTTLDYSDRGLTHLPSIPEGIVILYCHHNQLSFLPSLSYYCASHNSTKTQKALLFVSLPSSLKELRCDNNQLVELPLLPSSLQYLYCHNNQLTFLPELFVLLCFAQ